MNDIYLVKLHGKLADIMINPYAKINVKWINHIIMFKWYVGKNGYPFAYMNSSRMPLHRYIHYLIKGYWTTLIVDHVNRDKLDATDKNLREATPAENSYNKTFSNPNHNIRYNCKNATYEVKIVKNKVTHKISDIVTITDAQNIYKLMAEELFGEFAPI